MREINYITYNDTYSGIYQSQVIDVVSFLNKEFNVSVKLIAFVPLRLWKKERQLIRLKLPNAKVFPILGSLNNVKRTGKFFNFIKNKETAICRGPLAFVLAQTYYNKVVYDGRAAVEAEVLEYDVAGNKKIDELFISAENKAIESADYYISVSSKLIEYWETKLSRKIPSEKYSVIPCTLTSESNEANVKRDSTKVKVVYSGGTGAWQSFEKVVYLLDELMSKQVNVEVLFLTKENDFLNKLIKKYPNRCERKWLAHHEVYNELSSCDYGILLREDNVTNRVASPVKFAEYLNAGLKVLISPSIGDFSEFTNQNDCGVIVNEELPFLFRLNDLDRINSKELCEQYFLKDSTLIKENYKNLIKLI